MESPINSSWHGVSARVCFNRACLWLHQSAFVLEMWAASGFPFSGCWEKTGRASPHPRRQMEADMAFKKEGAEFTDTVRFKDYALSFAAEEAYEIVSYAFEHSTELGIDQEKIILAGHSAGGNLVASVLIKNEETKELHPCCALMEYFPTDNTVDPVERLSEELKKDPFWVKRAETEKMYTDFYVGDADPSDPLCSPAFAKDQALAAFPDCLIISAGEDSLRDDTEAFGMRLAKAGVCVTMQRITEAMHGFTTNRTPGWERALDRQYKFFQEHLR